MGDTSGGTTASRLSMEELEKVFQQTPYLDCSIDKEAVKTMTYLTNRCGLKRKAILQWFTSRRTEYKKQQVENPVPNDSPNQPHWAIFTDKQIKVLEMHFRTDTCPKVATRRQICKQIGVIEPGVRMWFDKTRYETMCRDQNSNSELVLRLLREESQEDQVYQEGEDVEIMRSVYSPSESIGKEQVIVQPQQPESLTEGYTHTGYVQPVAHSFQTESTLPQTINMQTVQPEASYVHPVVQDVLPVTHCSQPGMIQSQQQQQQQHAGISVAISHADPTTFSVGLTTPARGDASSGSQTVPVLQAQVNAPVGQHGLSSTQLSMLTVQMNTQAAGQVVAQPAIQPPVSQPPIATVPCLPNMTRNIANTGIGQPGMPQNTSLSGNAQLAAPVPQPGTLAAPQVNVAAAHLSVPAGAANPSPVQHHHQQQQQQSQQQQQQQQQSVGPSQLSAQQATWAPAQLTPDANTSATTDQFAGPSQIGYIVQPDGMFLPAIKTENESGTAATIKVLSPDAALRYHSAPTGTEDPQENQAPKEESSTMGETTSGSISGNAAEAFPVQNISQYLTNTRYIVPNPETNIGGASVVNQPTVVIENVADGHIKQFTKSQLDEQNNEVLVIDSDHSTSNTVQTTTRKRKQKLIQKKATGTQTVPPVTVSQVRGSLEADKSKQAPHNTTPSSAGVKRTPRKTPTKRVRPIETESSSSESDLDNNAVITPGTMKQRASKRLQSRQEVASKKRQTSSKKSSKKASNKPRGPSPLYISSSDAEKTDSSVNAVAASQKGNTSSKDSGKKRNTSSVASPAVNSIDSAGESGRDDFDLDLGSDEEYNPVTDLLRPAISYKKRRVDTDNFNPPQKQGKESNSSGNKRQPARMPVGRKPPPQPAKNLTPAAQKGKKPSRESSSVPPKDANSKKQLSKNSHKNAGVITTQRNTRSRSGQSQEISVDLTDEPDDETLQTKQAPSSLPENTTGLCSDRIKATENKNCSKDPKLRSVEFTPESRKFCMKTVYKTCDDVGVYQCPLCDYLSVTHPDISNHFWKRHKEMLYVCEINPGDDPFVELFMFCRLCDYVAVEKCALWEHFFQFHCFGLKKPACCIEKDCSKSVDKYVCPACAFVCNIRLQIVDHIQFLHDDLVDKKFAHVRLEVQAASGSSQQVTSDGTNEFLRMISGNQDCYICTECLHASNSALVAKKHYRLCHVSHNLLFVCNRCLKWSTRQETVTAHLETEHSVTNESERCCSVTMLWRSQEIGLLNKKRGETIANSSTTVTSPRSMLTRSSKKNSSVVIIDSDSDDDLEIVSVTKTSSNDQKNSTPAINPTVSLEPNDKAVPEPTKTGHIGSPATEDQTKPASDQQTSDSTSVVIAAPAGTDPVLPPKVQEDEQLPDSAAKADGVPESSSTPVTSSLGEQGPTEKDSTPCEKPNNSSSADNVGANENDPSNENQATLPETASSPTPNFLNLQSVTEASADSGDKTASVNPPISRDSTESAEDGIGKKRKLSTACDAADSEQDSDCSTKTVVYFYDDKSSAKKQSASFADAFKNFVAPAARDDEDSLDGMDNINLVTMSGNPDDKQQLPVSSTAAKPPTGFADAFQQFLQN